jgi:hypothetical protein
MIDWLLFWTYQDKHGGGGGGGDKNTGIGCTFSRKVAFIFR